MSIDKGKINEYLNKTRFIVLATVDENRVPVLRSLGSFGVDGLTAYFSTGKNSRKVGQIRENPGVSLLFQHEEQQLQSFINVTITGDAHPVTEEEEINRAVAVLSARNPGFKERVEKGLLSNNIFFRVDPKELKIVDFSKGTGPAAVEVIDAAEL